MTTSTEPNAVSKLQSATASRGKSSVPEASLSAFTAKPTSAAPNKQELQYFNRLLEGTSRQAQSHKGSGQTYRVANSASNAAFDPLSTCSQTALKNKKADKPDAKQKDKDSEEQESATKANKGPAEIPLVVLPTTYQPPVADASALSPSQQIQQLATELIDKIFASNAQDPNKQEVTILFNSAVLAATNVRIAKHGEAFDIFFHTASQHSAALLNHHENALRKHLQEALSTSRVNIQLENQSGDSDTPQQQGRNVMQYEEMALDNA